MKNSFVIGVDIGTTGTKAVLLDNNGKILHVEYMGYKTYTSDKKSEQKAEDWWRTFVYTVKECSKKANGDVAAISISSQGGSVVPVDTNGMPLYNAITWIDSRSIKQKQELLQNNSDEFYYNKTGWRLHEGLCLCKLKWLHENENEVFNKTYKFLTTADYIYYMLTGKYIIDPSNAAMTQFFNINTQEWDKELCELSNIAKDKLPKIIQSGDSIGALNQKAIDECEINESTKVFAGGHDQYCSATGVGAIENGEIIIATGTAWVTLGISNEPFFDIETGISPGKHIVKNKWGLLSSMGSVGLHVEEYIEKLDVNCTLAELDMKAEERINNTEELFFYPFFKNKKYENANNDGFVGQESFHNEYGLFLALLEGIAFQEKFEIEKYIKRGFSASNIIMTGGASKSELWSEIVATVLNKDIICLNNKDSSPLGAAIIAAIACGMFKSYEQAYNKIDSKREIIQPKKELVTYYKTKYEKYKKGLN